MKFSVVPTGIQHKTLDQIQEKLIEEFKNPKFESKCITEIKEIKWFPTKFVWDFNQRFKTLMAKVSFQMSEVQHKEWFIATLLPDI